VSRERNDAGRYVESVALEDVLEAFDRVRGPVVTSSDVAELLDCSPETARRKLGELRDRGRVESRETAGRVVWWRTDPDGADGNGAGDDPLFGGEPITASGESDTSENVDEVLYGDPHE
jgi:hypothetical protein